MVDDYLMMIFDATNYANHENNGTDENWDELYFEYLANYPNRVIVPMTAETEALLAFTF